MNQKKKGGAPNGTLPTPEGPAPATPAFPLPPPSNITISSLGIVNEYVTGEYGKCVDGKPAVRVREYNFSIDMMTRQMVTYVGTFRGRLQLAMSYNDGYYDEDAPKDILIRVEEALAQGMGLELEAS